VHGHHGQPFGPVGKAAKQWKFKPFIQNEKAVKIATRIPFDFAFAGDVTEVPPTITTAADGTKRALVSEGVSNGLLIHKVRPEYPEIALSHRVEGAVVLHAIIGKRREDRVTEAGFRSGDARSSCHWGSTAMALKALHAALGSRSKSRRKSLTAPVR
jgi:hypothetical protein